MLTPTFTSVVGIVASRIKDKLYRPTFVFLEAQQRAARSTNSKARAARSPAFTCAMRALPGGQWRYRGVILNLGGHAMAAGCTGRQRNRSTCLSRPLPRSPGRVAPDAATLTRKIN